MATFVTLPTGRKISYLLSGAPKSSATAPPLLFVHGTPGALTVLPDLSDACAQKGIPLISFSRAGYGDSGRNSGRRQVDEVADAEAVIRAAGFGDELEAEKGGRGVLVGGWSGGGPPALACAARLKGCRAALVVAGVAPYGVEGLDWLAGQGQDNIDEFDAAQKGEEALRMYCDGKRPEMLEGDAKSLTEAMASILPESDKHVMLTHASLGEYMVASMHESLKHGCDGWIDDDLAMIQPWGFSLSEISCPVFLYQGDEDMMVPLAHGKWLAEHLPGKVLVNHFVQGEGHVSIFVNLMEKMLEQLAGVVQK